MQAVQHCLHQVIVGQVARGCTLSLLSLHTRLSALFQHSEEDLEQSQQHLGLRRPGCGSVSSSLGLLEGPFNFVSTPHLLALALCLGTLLFACSRRMGWCVYPGTSNGMLASLHQFSGRTQAICAELDVTAHVD